MISVHREGLLFKRIVFSDFCLTNSLKMEDIHHSDYISIIVKCSSIHGRKASKVVSNSDLTVFLITDFSELTLNSSLEERISFTNMVTCSQVHFK